MTNDLGNTKHTISIEKQTLEKQKTKD